MSQSHGFTLIREAEIPELNTRAQLFRHDRSGARLLSLQNEDENKVFGISFRTPPPNSTGVPHIMEHAVLCGSHKFPLKEPFVELLKGSLKTFLNAFTFPDKTCYPVASTNLKDFYNLVDVYLDSVFYPLIPAHVLAQEGWHYELGDPAEQMFYKGVVFNEMKGAYSSPYGLLSTRSRQSLFPETAYQYDSGGDPVSIPDLTYQQFKSFHESYYHPSNAYIYFYGDDDPGERLRILDEYLREFDARSVSSEVDLQTPFEEPRRFEFAYDAGEVSAEDGERGIVSVNWMLAEVEDLEEALALDILSHILIGNQAAPLRKALIDSGLGEDLTASGLEEQLRQMTFSVGLKGIIPDQAGHVEELILRTLTDLASEGIDPATVEASINTTEFRLRELNTGGFPRGLVLMLWSLSAWIYDRDPIDPLYYQAPLESIKRRLRAGEPVFEDLLGKYLLQNHHRTTVLLRPDEAVRPGEEAREKARLEQARSRMSAGEIDQVVADTLRLKEIQSSPDSPEDLARLPFLSLSDLDKQNKLIPKEELQIGTVRTLYHDLFTNGIIYLEVGFDLSLLSEDLLPYLPLFSRSLFGLGTHKEDFVVLTQRIGRKTGGLGTRRLISSSLADPAGISWLFLRGKCTLAQSADMLDILSDVLFDVRLDHKERFLQLVLEAKAGKEAGLIPGGHGVVNGRLKAHFSPASRAAEQIGGLSNLFFTRQLVEQVRGDWPAVLEKLEKIRRVLLNRNAMVANITVDAEDWKHFRPQLVAFLDQFPASQTRRQTWSLELLPENEGLTAPSQVNFVGKGANLFELGYRPHGSALVARRYLSTTWLWDKVRVQGGAYGGMSSYGRISGTFTFFSYRDPNLMGTLDNFDGASSFLKELSLSDDELTKAIIGTISDIDAYQLPDAKGYTSLVRHLAAISDENRQQLRDEILSTRPADIRAFGDALGAVRDHGHVVILGSPDAIETANRARGGDWLRVQKIL